MTISHKTASGSVELIGKEWRDGQSPQRHSGVACITVHDDVTNAVWAYTGKLRDAAEVVGALYVGTRDKMAVLSGLHIEIEQPADDLMIGKGGPNEDGEFDEFQFNAAVHPDVVAY